MKLRTITKILAAMEKPEGVGATVRRSIGVVGMRNFDPFLMLDHFNIGLNSGFPEHPHSGQETITYVLSGGVAHEDFTGSRGVLYEGDLQFMTAGKGVVHSEMPLPEHMHGRTSGIQLWVDLPEKLKESKPRYRDLRKNTIPEVVEQDGKLRVKVISGNSYGVESVKELAYTPIDYYQVTLKPGATYTQKVPEDFNFFLYPMRGNSLVIGHDTKLPAYNTCFFNRDGDTIVAENKGTSEDDVSEFVVVGGQVLDQKVVHYGPFVATSQGKIREIIENYSFARNGFENISTWRGLISDGVTEKMVKEELECKERGKDYDRSEL